MNKIIIIIEFLFCCGGNSGDSGGKVYIHNFFFVYVDDSPSIGECRGCFISVSRFFNNTFISKNY